MNDRNTPEPTINMRAFRKAHASGNLGCVEVSLSPHGIGVRDSKHHTGPVLEFTPHEWRIFLQAVRDGEFDI